MVQRKTLGAALVGLALLFALVSGIASTHLIATSKHNLGASGLFTIKAAAGGTTEICVFCHTPHAANMTPNLGVPLWNKGALTTATYTLYSSIYLTGLDYPSGVLGAGQSSRVCLSCHDGTLALGSVVNSPGSGLGSGSIQMADSGTNITLMPTTAAGFLGTDLANDHPVGYLYLPGTAARHDPELVTRAFPWPKGVQLDPNAASAIGPPETGGRVECKSCHDPHDNQFTKFLRMSNANAGLCKYCHNKTNYDLSAHNTSIQTYTRTGSLPTTVGGFSCIACHKPHTGGGTPLLRGAEELTCYDAGCHGGNNPITGNTTQGAKNIQPEMIKAWSHPTNTISSLHKNIFGGETQAQLDANRHAECMDCHNPHQVRPAVAKGAAIGALTRRGDPTNAATLAATPPPAHFSRANRNVGRPANNLADGAHGDDNHHQCCRRLVRCGAWHLHKG